MYYYISDKQLRDIVNNAISYGANKIDARFTLMSKVISEVKAQELDEVQGEELQTESTTKSVLIKDLPSNIKSYSLGKITKENITPYLKKYGFAITEKAEIPAYLIVDWNSKNAVFSNKKNGIVNEMETFFDSLDLIKEGKSFRDSASTLLETQEFDWF